MYRDRGIITWERTGKVYVTDVAGSQHSIVLRITSYKIVTVCGHGGWGVAGLPGGVVLSLSGVCCKEPILVIKFWGMAIPLGA